MARDRTAAADDTTFPWFMGTEPPKPPLTHERIVGAAHALIHTSGIDALSVRTLARELGVGASKLHRRIERKEHLLVAVADLVLSEIGSGPDMPSSGTGETSWRAELRAFSLEVRRVLGEHPHVHPVLDTYVLVTPAAVRVSERAVAILRRAGYDGDTLVDAYNAWSGYVFGFSVLETQPEQRLRDRAQLERWVRAYLGSLDADEHPALSGSLPDLENRAFGLRWDAGPLGRDGTSFGFGLDALLDGLPAPGASSR